jgi:hypothetical protein
MNTKAPRRLQQLRTQWVRWDAQLRGIGVHAPRGTRRWLATGYLVCVAADPAAALLVPDTAAKMVWFVDLIVALVLLGVMRSAIRDVADAPDDALDEMLTRIRNSYRSRAYRLLAICVAMGCVVLTIPTAPAFGITLTLTNGIVQAVIWPLFLLCVGLPTLLASWSLPDLDHPAE